MKVLFISEYWPPKSIGGGEISAEAIAKTLSKKGINITVLTSKIQDCPIAESKDNIKIYRKLKTGQDPASLISNIIRAFIFPISVKLETKKLLKKEKFDIIHYFNTTSALGLIKHNKTFVHINSPVFFCPKGTLLYKDEKECHYKCTPLRFIRCFLKSREIGKLKNKWYLRYNPIIHIYLYLNYKIKLKKLKKFNYYIAVSEFMKEKLLENSIKENKISIIYNITKESPKQNNKNKTKSLPYIVYLGNYTRNKGAPLLIKALKHIKENFKCEFYGSGPLENELIELAKNDNRIKINKSVPYSKAKEIIREADILAQPSIVPEALPRNIIDAMMHKKLVVTTNVGSMKYLIKNGEDGLVFNPEDDIKTISGIIKRAFDENLRERIGKKAHDKIIKLATEDIVTKKLIEAYKCAA
jgi:glycosyltransferase involved in cell wall biosynthesis